MDSPSHSCSYQHRGRANAILSSAWDCFEISCVLSTGEILFRLFSPYHYTPGIVPLIVCSMHRCYPCINSNSDLYFAWGSKTRACYHSVFIFNHFVCHGWSLSYRHVVASNIDRGHCMYTKIRLCLIVNRMKLMSPPFLSLFELVFDSGEGRCRRYLQYI